MVSLITACSLQHRFLHLGLIDVKYKKIREGLGGGGGGETSVPVFIRKLFERREDMLEGIIEGLIVFRNITLPLAVNYMQLSSHQSSGYFYYLTSGHKRSHDSVTECLIFANLVSKYP